MLRWHKQAKTRSLNAYDVVYIVPDTIHIVLDTSRPEMKLLDYIVCNNKVFHDVSPSRPDDIIADGTVEAAVLPCDIGSQIAALCAMLPKGSQILNPVTGELDI